MIDFGRVDTPTTQVAQQAPAIVEQTAVTRKTGTAEASYLLKPADQWTWESLRDYVVTEAEKRFGAQVRDPKKEAGIFRGFIARHGIQDAVMVAMAAFEIYEGTWRSAPVTVTRFCKNSDPFFSEVILARLKG
jgi:hypothetical protein